MKLYVSANTTLHKVGVKLHTRAALSKITSPMGRRGHIVTLKQDIPSWLMYVIQEQRVVIFQILVTSTPYFLLYTQKYNLLDSKLTLSMNTIIVFSFTLVRVQGYLG